MDVKYDIISYVTDKGGIMRAPQLPAPFATVYEKCCECAFNTDIKCDDLLKIDAVIDYLHDKLHTGHWSTVHNSTRNGYAAACYVKAVLLLEMGGKNMLFDAIKSLDMGILLGGSLEENPDLLQKSATRVNQALATTKGKSSIIPLVPIVPFYRLKKYSQINYENIRIESLPSLEMFIKDHFIPEIPIVIKDAIQHWPAIQKWLCLSYLLKTLGERTVPIEIGSQYSDEDWSQKLITFEEFVKKYYLECSGKIGYLAQHNLFHQVPELRSDFSVPDYCSASRADTDDDEDVDINVWFGPEGTVSSLHYDRRDNLLAQVYGIKQVIMSSPADSDNLYPHSSEMLFNTAQVDPIEPDLDRFPKFKNAKLFKCLLQHGDMLYIPRKWWHHVTSLDRSFSINFWWS